MNTERLIERLIQALVTVGGILLSIFLAKSAGEGNMSLVGGVFGGALALVLIIGLRELLWVIIPIFWTLSGHLLVLPLPFAVRDVAIMVAFAGYLTLIALKVVRRKATLDMTDYVLVVMAVYVVTVYVRN